MDTIEVASSPGSLSSPPHSPEQGNNSTIVVSSNVGVSPAPASTQTTPRLTASGQPRKKPGPKPKPKDPSTAVEKKPRRPRKPAEPKDPAAEPATRKRRAPKASLESQPTPPPAVKEESTPVHLPPTPTPQPRPTEMVQVLHPEPPAITPAPRVLSNPEPIQSNPSLSHISVAPSTPRPASSGQRYDPIRGGLMDSKPQSTPSAPPISPPLNRASASPSITSLIDPPSAANSIYTQAGRLQQQPSVTSAPVSPAAIASRPAPVFPQQEQPPQPPQPLRATAPLGTTTPMEVDSDANSTSKMSVPMKKTDSTSAGTPSNAPTPPSKPARQKEAPPPLPTGSGLLSGTPFGPIASNNANGSAESQGTNIWLTFPLKGQTNVTINFAQEVEKKYGFAALHPRIAARRERQRQITAAGAALERSDKTGSADDMSLDLSEPESNVEMGGMDDDASGRDGAKKRRKRKQEDYDKEDDFIDDTELAWEQSALMARDGFFVYSGPLLTEGEKPTVERADGTVKRGRGRGRGGTARGETAGRGRGRGGGPGSRGGSTVRKPRVTKADRAMMEQEKHEREKLAATMAAKQPQQPAAAYPAATPV